MSARLRVAVQRKGRLADASASLLERAGVRLRRAGPDALLQRAENLPIDVLRVRDDDIAPFVAEGVCDLGFVGLNVLAERGLAERVEIVARLGFGRCALKIAVPEGVQWRGVDQLEGARIATSHPELLRDFLKRQGVGATAVEMHGSVELAPRLGIASAICDLVSTGATLEANGLKPVETVFESEACLVRSTSAPADGLAEVRDRFLRRIEGVIATDGAKYIMLNAPRSALPAITDLLPGAGAPTVVPLAGETEAVAVHAVCQESVFWETLERLKAAGASAILVMPIEKMMH